MAFSFLTREAGRVHVCGHRGYSLHYPENTLPAFAAAKAWGATTIEVDIVLTAEGEPIVLHDRTLEIARLAHVSRNAKRSPDKKSSRCSAFRRKLSTGAITADMTRRRLTVARAWSSRPMRVASGEEAISPRLAWVVVYRLVSSAAIIPTLPRC